MKGGIKSRKEKKKEVRIIICHFLVFWQLRIFCADEKTQGRTPREEKGKPKILTLSIWSSLRRCQSASIAALYSTYTTGVKKKKWETKIFRRKLTMNSLICMWEESWPFFGWGILSLFSTFWHLAECSAHAEFSQTKSGFWFFDL